MSSAEERNQSISQLRSDSKSILQVADREVIRKSRRTSSSNPDISSSKGERPIVQVNNRTSLATDEPFEKGKSSIGTGADCEMYEVKPSKGSEN